MTYIFMITIGGLCGLLRIQWERRRAAERLARALRSEHVHLPVPE